MAQVRSVRSILDQKVPVDTVPAVFENGIPTIKFRSRHGCKSVEFAFGESEVNKLATEGRHRDLQGLQAVKLDKIISTWQIEIGEMLLLLIMPSRVNDRARKMSSCFLPFSSVLMGKF